MAYNRTLQHFTSPQELATLWATGRDYLLNQVVIQDNKLYRCLVNHTSGTFQTDYANSNWVELSSGMVPWVTAVYYTANQFVEENDKIYRCLVSHTSTTFSADIGAGKWVEISAGSGSGTKNYITNGDFEQNTDTGWSLASSTLDATTKLPNQVSASWTAASGSLSKSVISSGQLAGSYSLQLSSTAATTAGNMLVTDALALDLEAQATIQTFSFFYKVAANGVVTNITTTSGLPTITVASASGIIPGMILNSTNGGGTVLTVVGTTITLSNNASVTGTVSGTFTNTLPGTSSNPLGVAIYDATNNQWIQPAGVYNLVQSSGVGQSSGTFQVPSNCTSVRLAVYFPNSAGATATYPFTVVFDDFQLGPQKVLAGAAISDWVSYTPTFGAGFGTVTTSAFWSRRVGDSLEVFGKWTNGTVAASTASITVGYNGINANVIIDTSKVSPNAIIGTAQTSLTSTTQFGVYPIAPGSNATTIAFTVQNSTTAFGSGAQLGTTISASGSQNSVHFTVPIVGWSSNTVMSSDTDTRVVAASAYGSPAIASAGNPIIFATSSIDTHASYSVSTGRYTVPVSGKYRLSYVHNSTNTYLVTPYINAVNTGIVMGSVISGAGSGSIILDLQAGQIVDHRPSGSTGAFSGSGGNFSIERLSGPATIAASETVAMRAYKTTGSHTSSGNWQTVGSYDSAPFDTHNALNITTGEYTVPVSGSYLVSSLIGFTANSTGVRSARVELNGSMVLQGSVISAPSASVLNTLVYVGIVKAIAGQKISLSAFQNSTISLAYDTTANASHFSIVRVGN